MDDARTPRADQRLARLVLGLRAVTRIDDLPARPAPDLYFGAVRGRPFVHAPWSHEALAVLDEDSERLLRAADGRPLAEVATELAGLDPERRERLLAAASVLVARGFLVAPGVPVPSPPEERFFNVWVHVTNACNLACPHCYIAKSDEKLAAGAADTLLRAIEATAASGSVDRIHLRFAGGEPMLRFRDVRWLHAEATRRCGPHGVRVTGAVITNGTVVPPGAPEWFAGQGISLSVSIDGLREAQEVMRPMRTGGSSWHRVEAGLDRYRRAGVAPYVLVTVGRDNLEGIPDLVDHLLVEALPFRLSLVRDLESGAAPLAAPGVIGRLLAVLAETYARIERAIEARARAGRPFSPAFRRTHRFCDLELWRPLRKACGAGETYLAVGQDGAASACHAALHHARDHRLAARGLPGQASAQTLLRPFDRSAGNAECNGCRFRASCAGGCPLLLYRRDGHVDGRSPYCAVYRDVIPRVLGVAASELALET